MFRHRRRRGTLPRALAACAALAAAGCQAPACSNQPLATLPLLDEPTGLYVQVQVDGRVLKLLLDTGSDRTLLTSATASQLGLRVEHLLDDTDVLEGYAINGVGGRRHIDRAWPKRIELGLAPVIATPVSVVWSGDRSWDRAGDGILGMDLLAAYDMDLDMPARRLGLYAPGGLCLPHDAQASALPRLGELSQGPWVPVRVSGLSLHALIDSGAQRSFVMSGAARALGHGARLGPQDARLAVTGVGTGREVAVLHGFDRVTLGALVIPRLEMAVADSLRGPGVILGEDVLRHMRVWVPARGSVYVAPG